MVKLMAPVPFFSKVCIFVGICANACGFTNDPTKFDCLFRTFGYFWSLLANPLASFEGQRTWKMVVADLKGLFQMRLDPT